MSTAGRLGGFLWTPNAHDAGGTYSGPPYYDYPPSILLHMTVSMGISQSYIAQHPYPPHLWGNPYNGAKYQTVELDRSAFALYQPPYGYHWKNKKTLCLQTELVGVPIVNVATYTRDQLTWIAREIVVPQEQWLRSIGKTANVGNFKYHTDSSGSASVDWPGRMLEQEWADYNGLLAHIDGWADDHWDCSVEHIDLISHDAVEMLDGHPVIKPEEGPGMKLIWCSPQYGGSNTQYVVDNTNGDCWALTSQDSISVLSSPNIGCLPPGTTVGAPVSPQTVHTFLHYRGFWESRKNTPPFYQRDPSCPEGNP